MYRRLHPPVLRIVQFLFRRPIKPQRQRTIPVHPALIAEGFPAYVASLPPRSSLFPDIRPDAVFQQRGTAASTILARWTRAAGITDTTVSPAHSYRHWFVEAARRALIHPEVRSALTGHSARMDESAGYGASMGSFVAVLAEAMVKVRPPGDLWVPPMPAAAPANLPPPRTLRPRRRPARGHDRRPAKAPPE